MGIDARDGEEIAFTDLDRNRGDDGDGGSGLDPTGQTSVLGVASVSHSFDTREKDVHIRPASLFCLLSSLTKCKVGRESL